MAILASGEVVVVPFPFSDLSQSKYRPAIVLADAGRGDWILCQVTSKPYADALAVAIQKADFSSGSLPLTSYARPGKLFTAHQGLVVSQAGLLNRDRFDEILDAVIEMFQKDTAP